MHGEGVEQAGRNLAAEAIAAEGALREMAKRPCADWSRIPNELMPRGTAMSGLLLAVPMSLSLWMMIGMLLWALVR